MTGREKSSKFGLGLLIGTIIGAVSGLFLAPKPGKETRKEVKEKLDQLRKLLKEREVDKRVKEIFGEVTEEGKKVYHQAKEQLIKKLAGLKKTVKEINKEEYGEKVEEVVKKIQKQTRQKAQPMEKLKKQLLKEWGKLKG